MSSIIAQEIIEDKSIPYDIVKFKDKLCSKCKLFTDKNTGFIPFYKFINPNKHYSMKEILDICKKMNCENEFRTMIFIDSVVFNQDRHLGNFGFLIDNETQQIKEFAPLFDYNLSMLCNALMEDINSVERFHKYEEEYMLEHKLGGKFSEVGKEIATKEIKELIPQNIFIPEHSRYNLPKKRIEKILDIFEENIHQITGNKNFFPSYSINNLQVKKNIKNKSGKEINKQKLQNIILDQISKS